MTAGIDKWLKIWTSVTTAFSEWLRCYDIILIIIMIIISLNRDGRLLKNPVGGLTLHA